MTTTQTKKNRKKKTSNQQRPKLKEKAMDLTSPCKRKWCDTDEILISVGEKAKVDSIVVSYGWDQFNLGPAVRVTEGNFVRRYPTPFFARYVDLVLEGSRYVAGAQRSVFSKARTGTIIFTDTRPCDFEAAMTVLDALTRNGRFLPLDGRIVPRSVFVFLDKFIFSEVISKIDQELLRFLDTELTWGHPLQGQKAEAVVDVIVQSHAAKPFLNRTLEYATRQLNKRMSRRLPSERNLFWLKENHITRLQAMYADGSLTVPSGITREMASETAFPPMLVGMISANFTRDTVNSISINGTGSMADQKYYHIFSQGRDTERDRVHCRIPKFSARNGMLLEGSSHRLYIGKLNSHGCFGDWTIWATREGDAIKPLWRCVNSCNHPLPFPCSWITIQSAPAEVKDYGLPTIGAVYFVASFR